MTNSGHSIEQVRAALQKFQDGYIHRDPDKVDDFMELFISEDELEVIGTGASSTGEGEWCIGPAMARDLVEGDWKYWGDLRLDVEGARIFTRADVAWLATDATVTMTLPAEEEYQNYLEYARKRINRDTDPELILLEQMRNTANTVYELRRGDHFVWPLRFTAVLVRDAGQWRFHQMQFSFPTTNFPDVRRVEGE